jgi:hypothetical protein
VTTRQQIGIPSWPRGAGRASMPVALSAVALAFGLTACGSSSSKSAGSPSSAPTNHGGSSSAGAVTGGADNAKTGITAPGASLAVGQTATLLYNPAGAGGSPTFKLKITVESINKGTLADFNGVQLNAAQKAGTPEYVKVRIVNVGTGALVGSQDYPAVPLQGVDNTGQTQQSVTFIGDFPPCPDRTAPKPFSPGQTFATCLTFLVPGGITKVAWTGTNRYINSPVVWAPR